MSIFTDAVQKHAKLIIDAQNYIWANAETGYREVKTSKYMADAFEALGYTLTKPGDIPGFYTVIDTGRKGPEVLILGELDSLICPDHPDSDKETGAVHCCGHSAQCAALLGVAAALKEPGALDGMCGRIRLCAVPAEELIEIEYRNELIKKGIIKYYGGKTEFMYRGYFEGVDLAFMVHTTSGDKILIRESDSVGMVSKKVAYKGKSAHAGGAPWQGINALYAATQGLSAANAMRETFKEADYIRFHPIITKGGNAVNAIPDSVTIEAYVRGISFDAIQSANKKINRALCGAALSIGGNVEISDYAGYAPMSNDKTLLDCAKEAATEAGYEYTVSTAVGTGSTDMGDISNVMPAIHPYMPGAVGTSHGKDYFIANPDLACVGSAKWQIELLNILLKDNAARAYEVINNFKPRFASKKEYFDAIDSLASSGERITYTDNGATVTL